MSYWSDHPELLEEVTIAFLPDPYKSVVESGKLKLEKVPEDVVDEAMLKGTEDYWASLTSYIHDKIKDQKLEKAVDAHSSVD